MLLCYQTSNFFTKVHYLLTDYLPTLVNRVKSRSFKQTGLTIVVEDLLTNPEFVLQPSVYDIRRLLAPSRRAADVKYKEKGCLTPGPGVPVHVCRNEGRR